MWQILGVYSEYTENHKQSGCTGSCMDIKTVKYNFNIHVRMACVNVVCVLQEEYLKTAISFPRVSLFELFNNDYETNFKSDN